MQVLRKPDRWGELADRIAADCDGTVTTGPETLQPGPVLYVAPPAELSEETVLSLQRRLCETGPDAGGFGIITGQTRSAAYSLFQRGWSNGQPETRSRHAIMLREETRDWFSYDEETTVATGPAVTAERLRTLSPELRSLSLLVHGRSMHFYLDDGYLCGFPDQRAASFDGPQPFCVADDGEMACPLEGQVVHADGLAVPHLFVDSCASMLPGNDYAGLPVHVGAGLLEGATTLVGVYRQIDSLPQLSLLNYCLLRAGYTAAQRCYLLNRTAHAYNTAAYPYALFGWPAARGGPPDAGSYRVEAAAGGSVTVTDVDAHVLDVRLDGPTDADALYVRNETDALAGTPLYGVAFPRDDGVRVLVYTWGRIEDDEVTIRLSVDESSVAEADRRIVSASLDNADGLTAFNLIDKKGRGQLRDLTNRYEGVSADVYEQRYDVNAYRDVEETMGDLAEALGRVEQRVVDRIEGRSSTFLSDDYRPDVRETGVSVGRGCPNCDRRVFEKRVETTTGSSRHRGICPLCGVVYDATDPTAGRHTTVEGDLVPVTDDSVSFDVTFRNARDRPVRATYVPWLGTDDDDHRGAEIFAPGSETRRLSPGETATVPFTGDVSGLKPNEYWLCAYVLENLRVQQAVRRMVVGSDYGHLRQDRRA